MVRDTIPGDTTDKPAPDTTRPDSTHALAFNYSK
jgi:hypothetical protein